ncbi:hypothetical protein AVEN_263475-1 [Araneus ventricosus]|uniref:Uncharacterized protein n=1 Tax=Araneus ventricosus TaxID=182803 RepID=A0A4Y2EXG9_ARAVE|nr:hypothetical protein AVEN_263475-1 [Araneus ventricosus]
MTLCRSNNSTSPLPSSLHSCLAEAPIQSMIWAGEAGQEQGQEEKVFSLSMNFKFLMCPLRNLANAVWPPYDLLVASSWQGSVPGRSG